MSSNTTITLHIPILYGSQTGNSQSCAETLASTLPQTLTTLYNSQHQKTTNLPKIKITSSAKQLDDFLEFDHASWPRYFIIICSSYGVGQAPLGCWKFRELCDAILDSSNNDTNKMKETTLQGIQYSMLGLGDSKYSTFFLNPTAIDSALHKVGAMRIGKLGKADASGTGDNTQSIVMNNWCENIGKDILEQVLNKIVKESEDDRESMECLLKKAKEETGGLCKEIFEDWEEEGKKEVGKGNYSTSGFMILVVVVFAVVVAFIMKK
jgi:sulfite reductase alpha subunit-like flavoprotein